MYVYMYVDVHTCTYMYLYKCVCVIGLPCKQEYGSHHDILSYQRKLDSYNVDGFYNILDTNNLKAAISSSEYSNISRPLNTTAYLCLINNIKLSLSPHF